jgi:hypothetical protein
MPLRRTLSQIVAATALVRSRRRAFSSRVCDCIWNKNVLGQFKLHAL